MLKQQNWPASIAGLIAQLAPEANLAAFRNRFAEQVRIAKAHGDPALPAALERVRDLAEATTADGSQMAEPEMWREWSMLHDSPVVPDEVLVAVVRRFPRAATDDSRADERRDELLLVSRSPAIARAIESHRPIGADALAALASRSRLRFFASAMLDVCVERGKLPLPSKLWTLCAQQKVRPSHLLPANALLIHCYRASDDPGASLAAAKLLRGDAAAAGRFWRDLFASPGQLRRLIRFLCAAATDGRAAEAAASLHVLGDVIARCDAAVADGTSGEARTAHAALAELRLALELNARDEEPRADDRVTELARRLAVLTEAWAGRALRAAAGNAGRGEGDWWLTLSGRELADATRRHLDALPGDSGTSGIRRAGDAEFRGLHDLARQIIEALAAPDASTDLRGAVEVALFNAGVREIGAVGERVEFDPRIHEARDADVIEGDVVSVELPGRQWGGSAQPPIVLRRAHVARDRVEAGGGRFNKGTP